MTLQLTVRLFSACSCSREGSTSEICDQRTGQCSCRQRFIGRQCDRCQVSQIRQLLGQFHMSGHSDSLPDQSSVMDVRLVRCYIHGPWIIFLLLFSGEVLPQASHFLGRYCHRLHIFWGGIATGSTFSGEVLPLAPHFLGRDCHWLHSDVTRGASWEQFEVMLIIPVFLSFGGVYWWLQC